MTSDSKWRVAEFGGQDPVWRVYRGTPAKQTGEIIAHCYTEEEARQVAEALNLMAVLDLDNPTPLPTIV